MPTPLLWIAFLAQDPYVRTHDQEVRAMPRPGTVAPVDPTTREFAYPPVCSSFAAGKHGEAVPGGGTLNPVAFANPATIFVTPGGAAENAFVAQVSGAARNQGVFVHDGTTLKAIALGCGALGGGGSTGTCGDPSPLGGTFSGFFTGTVFAPAVNDPGDVLFMAEVVGGSSPRGLFLYQSASATIVKVAAVGDASPLGGSFAIVGPGTLNAGDQVAFLASGSSAGPADIFLWSAGSVTKVAAAGDPAPLGSTISTWARRASASPTARRSPRVPCRTSTTPATSCSARSRSAAGAGSCAARVACRAGSCATSRRHPPAAPSSISRARA